jgi:OOP family OmpA-OmpF porin
MNPTARARLIVSIASILAAATTISGCSAGPSTDPQAAIAVVIGQRANSAPLGRSPLLSAVVHSWVTQQADLSFVSSDGVPALVRNLNLSTSAPNDLYQREEQQAAQAQTISDLIDSQATTAQADPLDAIALAGRSVAESGGAKLVYIFDSGLQTTAPLAFQYGLLGESPSTVVSFLEANQELPDLRGVSVTWYGIGDTTSPQAPLTTVDYQRLEEIWSAILHASGAARVTIEEAPLPVATQPPGLPPVTLVPIQGVGNPPSRAIVVTLDPTSVSFVPNEADYLNPAQALQVLKAVASAIREGGYSQVSVTGTCALPCPTLSLERANTVATTLESFGLPPGDLTTHGASTDFPGFVPDVLPGGSLDPVAAERDRLVIVTATQ